MNRKLLLGAAAGVAAIALAVGGTTYSAWSDFGNVTGNSAGAGYLKLSLNGNDGSAIVPFSFGDMAPGGINAERQVWIASNDSGSTPSAQLYVSLTNLKGTENGCDSNGEQADDPNCIHPTSSDPSNQGQFITDSTVQWYSYVPTTPGVCNQSYSPAMLTVTPQYGGSLAALATNTATTPHELTGSGQAYNLPYLAPGAGVCFAMAVGLGYTVNNASQGDSANFDLHFSLVQAPYGTPTTPAAP